MTSEADSQVAAAFQPGPALELTETEAAVRESVEQGMARFPAAYWRERDAAHLFPHEFFDFAASQGWLGLVLPHRYGGTGLGISEAVVMLEAITRSGAGFSGASAIHMNVFGMNVVVRHGADEVREEILPKVASGACKVAFGVTERDAGLDTANIRTRAIRHGDRWSITGHKVWISTAQVADKILILARTAPAPADGPRTAGLTLFIADLDRSRVQIREIAKAGRHAVDSNELFIDGLEVPDAHRVGPEGHGFRLLLDGLNPERMLVAAEAVGIGRAALRLAVEYAKTRVVFGRPIGQNQGVQFPLADLHARLESAWLLTLHAARLYDNDRPCAAEANSAKLLGAEYGFAAADQAMQTLGGYGYATEYDVERLWREAKIARLAPVSPELILSFLAEHVLGLPRSY